MKLLQEAMIKFISGVILLALLLFIPAGTFKWFNAWLLMGLLFIPMFIAGLVMYFKAPDLLRSRLKAKESEGAQRKVIGASAIMFILVFVLAGLNYRFHWHQASNKFVVIGVVIFILSYLLFGEVLRENAFLSRTIEVQENQKVVDTGLYGVVRHPMYVAVIFLFLSMPLILNSVFSLFVMLSIIPILVKRIKNEEEVLEKELVGYKEYKTKVKYRLIPFIY